MSDLRICPSNTCPHFSREGERAEFVDGVTACSDCGEALVERVDGRPTASAASTLSAAPTSSDRFARLGVSLFVCGLFVALLRAPPLGVRPENFLNYDEAILREISPFATAIGAITIAPVYVEAIAIVVPWLRARRHDVQVLRAALSFASWIVAAIITALQAWSQRQVLSHGLGMDDTVLGAFYVSFAFAFLSIAGLTQALRRWGFGGAWLPLLAIYYGGNILNALRTQWASPDLGPRMVLLQVGYLAAWALLGWYFLSGRYGAKRGVPLEARSARVYREPLRPSGALHFRAPLWGSVAFMFAGIFEAIASTAGQLGFEAAAGLSRSITANPLLHGACNAVLALATLAVIRRLPTSASTTPARFASISKGASLVAEELALAYRGARVFALLGCGLGVVGRLARLPLCDEQNGVLVLVCFAVAVDLLGESRAHRRLGTLRAVATDQRVWRADVLASALEAAGIPSFVRAANFRTMTWWRSPLVSVEVMVSEERRAEALATLVALEFAQPPAPSIEAVRPNG